MLALKRRRDSNQKGIGGLGTQHCAQEASLHRPFHRPIQIGLDDMDLAAIDGLDRVLIDVDADNLLLAAGECHRRR